MRPFKAYVGVDKAGAAVTMTAGNASWVRSEVARATNGGSGSSCLMPADWNAAKRKGYRVATVDVIEHASTLDEAIAKLEAAIAEIEADDRHHYKPALVQVNAPLALIQTEMSARKEAYQKSLALLKRVKL